MESLPLPEESCFLHTKPHQENTEQTELWVTKFHGLLTGQQWGNTEQFVLWVN